MYPIKQSVAITVPFFVHDAAGDAVTGLTNASFTKRISKNGAAFAAMTVTITEMENGWYSFPLSTTHSNTAGILSITFTNAGAKQVNLQWRVQAKLIDDLNDFDAAADTVINVTNVAAATLDPTAQADLVDDIFDEILPGAHNITNSAGSLLIMASQIVAIDGSVVDASPTAAGFDTNLTEVDDAWRDNRLKFTDGILAGQSAPITTYSQTNGAMTFDEPFTSAPGNGDNFDIMSDHIHPITQISAGVWAESVRTITSAVNITSDGSAIGVTAGVVDDVTTVATNTDMRGTDGANTTVPDNAGITANGNAIAALNDVAATDIVTAGAIGTLSGAVVNVDLVDNCTANADMRGTNSALLAADINLTGGAVDTVTTVTNDVGITAQAVDDIMDEVITGGSHNVVDSLARRIRDLQELGVYESGAVWINTVTGTPGTTIFESGTVFNTVPTMADANTIASSPSLGLTLFKVAPGSTIPLAASQNNQAFIGENWTLTLGSQDVGGTLFVGAAVSGIGTGTSQIKFIGCALNGVTLHPFEARRCSLGGDMILQGTTPTDSDYFFHQCFSEIAGTATPSIDFGATETDTNVNMRDYSGGIEVKNMGQAGVDTMSLEGDGQLIINANCSGGTIAIRGNFTVTDNAGGAVTLVDDARYDTTQINTEVGVALNTTVLTESYAADGAAFTLGQFAYEMNQSVNEFAIVGTTYTVKERDGATTALTYALDSATVPTSKTRIT